MPTQPTELGAQSLRNLPKAPPQSIVSKMLLKTPSGSVTHFSFAEGEYLDEHETRFEALLIVQEGSAQIGVGNEAYQLSEGDYIHLPANIPHSVHPTGDMKMLLIMLGATDTTNRDK